jgi:CheY-like chemotaxis protein/HPt (histidine-containing phosphotransfer) domain-containing protein
MLVLRGLLPSPPLEVEVAINGRAALDRATQRRFDTIFLDLEMPVMGGLEAATRIRALQRERGEAASQLIAFSARDDEPSREACRTAGFDRFLVKPASREELLAVLGGGSPAADAGKASRNGELPTPDVHALALMPKFVSSRRAVLRELKDAARRGRRDEVQAKAHLLAGSFGMFGFHVASRLSREIERQAPKHDAAWLLARCEELSGQFERDQAHVLAQQPA